MSQSNLQTRYNEVCAKLGQVEVHLVSLAQDKAALLKEASELQKAWAMIVANTPVESKESEDVSK